MVNVTLVDSTQTGSQVDSGTVRTPPAAFVSPSKLEPLSYHDNITQSLFVSTCPTFLSTSVHGEPLTWINPRGAQEAVKVPGTTHLTGFPLLVALGTLPTVGDLIVDDALSLPHLRTRRR